MMLTEAETTSGKGYWTHLPSPIFHMYLSFSFREKLKMVFLSINYWKHILQSSRSMSASHYVSPYLSNRNWIIQNPFCQNHDKGSILHPRRSSDLVLSPDLKCGLILYCCWWTSGCVGCSSGLGLWNQQLVRSLVWTVFFSIEQAVGTWKGGSGCARFFL